MNNQRLQPNLSNHSSSPSNRAQCYAELAVSSPAALAESVALIAPTDGGMARLSGLDDYRDGSSAAGHQCRH